MLLASNQALLSLYNTYLHYEMCLYCLYVCVHYLMYSVCNVGVMCKLWRQKKEEEVMDTFFSSSLFTINDMQPPL